MVLQNAEKRYFHSEQNGHCIQPVTDVPSNFAHVFTDKVPALLARKSRGSLVDDIRDTHAAHTSSSPTRTTTCRWDGRKY